jgi:hypothetical protein
MKRRLTMSEFSDAELWQQIKERAKDAKKERAAKNMAILNGMISLFNIECYTIQEYHLRLHLPKGRKLDYFPQSGRATWLGTNKWFHINNIETFIRELYPDHPENKK